MGLVERWRRRRRADWCRKCKCEMERVDGRLFAMPGVSVGHYTERREPEYYREHLCPVEEKAEIPPGMYACGAARYRCPRCGRQLTLMDPFLPVREAEKHESLVLFSEGELDEFLWT